MPRQLPEIPITDAHVHFFSPNFIKNYANLGKEKLGSDAPGTLLDFMEWDMPDHDPLELGRRWVAEMDVGSCQARLGSVLTILAGLTTEDTGGASLIGRYPAH